MTVEDWRGDEVERAFRAKVRRNVSQAVLFLKGEVQKSINRSQPFRRSGARLIGLAPSAPGEPPKRLSNQLFQSIATETRETRDEIAGSYGSSLVYARALELGTDKMAARPYLRRALKENEAAVARIVGQA